MAIIARIQQESLLGFNIYQIIMYYLPGQAYMGALLPTIVQIRKAAE